jgi:uncharacterized membrane protein YhaH (DUF805 family)
MAQQSAWTRRYGLWLLLASSVAGLITAAIAAFDEGNGIAYSGGAYLVLFSTAVLVVAALALTLDRGASKWLAIILTILILLDLVGTGIAAYFLETTVLVAFMLVGLVGWLVYLLVDPARERPVPYRAAGRATR